MDRLRQPSAPVAMAVALLAVAALTGVLWIASRFVSLPSVPLLYLPIVLGASLWGTRPGVVAAVSSGLAYHVLFVAPFVSLRVAAVSDAISVGVYTATSLVISVLLARTRTARSEAERRTDTAARLAGLASSALAVPPSQAAGGVAAAIAATLGCSTCVLWMREGGRLERWASHGIGAEAAELDGPAEWCERERSFAGVAAGSRRFVVAPISGEGVSGALAVDEGPGSRRLIDDQAFTAGLSGLVALFSARSRMVRRELEAEAARRSDELKSSLLRMVSHELRTPLTSIKANVESLLAQPGHTQDDRETLAAVDAETDRLTRVVRNLLDASRIEAGQLRPSRHPFALRNLVCEFADRDGHAIEVDVSPDVYVLADPVLIDQLIRNLVENAERHGLPPVRVEALRDDGLVRVRVRDTGSGVPAEMRTRIFDSFVRLGRGGVGLGLALCKAIVEAHGGTIHAEQPPDGGFCVAFVLPAARGAEVAG